MALARSRERPVSSVCHHLGSGDPSQQLDQSHRRLLEGKTRSRQAITPVKCRYSPTIQQSAPRMSGSTAQVLTLNVNAAGSTDFKNCLGHIFIFLDTYIRVRVYEESAIYLRNHRRAESPRDLEPPGLVPTIGGRDRASTSYAAADGVQAPAGAARRRFCRVNSGGTAPPRLPETRSVSGDGGLAVSVPPVLVDSRGCSRTVPRPHGVIERGSVNPNEKK